jgi:1-phosphofructokinase family hexose kinase
MFLCVSPNPAIDKRLTLGALVPGEVLRAYRVESFPGGKSAHVAMVLRTLGETPRWIGLCGGATGSELVTSLCALGIEAQASTAHQKTRTNLEIIEDSGRVTELREPGDAPSAAALAEFERACESLFAQGGDEMTVIFSGSLPDGVAPDMYARLIWSAHRRGCRTLLDTGGEPFRLALAASPNLVKPNRDEAANVLGMQIDSPRTAVAAVRMLLSLGAQGVALSLGSEGLLFCASEGAPVLFAPALQVQVRSPVGCGDSALAGLASAIAASSPVEEVLRLAAACAAANCLADSPGAARLGDIQEFAGQIRVEVLDSGL